MADIIENLRRNIEEYNKLNEKMDKVRKERETLTLQLNPKDIENLTYENCKTLLDNIRYYIKDKKIKSEIESILYNKKILKYPQMLKPTYYPEINKLPVSENDKLRLDKLARKNYRAYIRDWMINGSDFTQKELEMFVNIGIVEKHYDFLCNSCGEVMFSISENDLNLHEKVWELKDQMKKAIDENKKSMIAKEIIELTDKGYGSIPDGFHEIMDYADDCRHDTFEDIDSLEKFKKYKYYIQPLYLFSKEPDLTYENL